MDASRIGRYEGFASGDGGATWVSAGTVDQQLAAAAGHAFRVMGQDQPVLIDGDVSTTIALSMIKTVDARGRIVWRNNGSRYDNFKTDFSVYAEADVAALIEQNAKNHSLSTATYPRPHDTIEYYYAIAAAPGFWIFSPYFEQSQTVEFAATATKTRGSFDRFGNLTRFTFSAIPRYRDVYSNLLASPEISSCYTEVQSVKVGDVWLPSPDGGKYKYDLNADNDSDQLHGDYSTVLHYERPYGEIADVSFRVDEELARRILSFLISNRTAVFPLEIGAREYPFGRDYPAGVYDCVLGDNTIRVKHSNLRDVTVSFKIQVREPHA